LSERKRGWKTLPKDAVPYKSSRDYQTGDWGVAKPIIDRTRCSKCTLCHFFCPEGAIIVRADGYTEVNYGYCKGCGVCANECPVKCIEMEMKK
jgi:2-oxoacid:acceptor oxidoreductase delta subunit (pyruvate/2-ketoisovalerate family)